MKTLVLGGGGREHALCWALARSSVVGELLCAPGNAGTADVARCIAADPTDVALIRELAVREGVELVVVGPETPLAAGVVDTLHTAGIAVFGPTRAAARIEASKAFAKEVIQAAAVPTARWWSGEQPDEAKAALEQFEAPYVVKADGLAAGKGVRICGDRTEAERAVDEAMVEGAFGEAGRRVVIEEFLAGPEVSLFGVCDGRRVVALGAAQDFKRALDGDRGLNTGGMGAYAPVPAVDDALVARLREQVLAPVAAELAQRGLPYVGVLYAGLVLTADGPKVLEFNARFGDPETQALLPRLRSDLGRLLAACAQGSLDEAGAVEWDERACVTVVLASGGYPGSYRTGLPIRGLGDVGDDALVFHAGTRRDAGETVTSGGRVLAVSALGHDIADARARAYAAADRISFPDLHRREDIATSPTLPL